MRIRTLITVAMAGALALTAGLVGVARITHDDMQRLALAQEHSQSALREASAMLVLAHEYALHGENRPIQQWHARREAVLRLLLDSTGEEGVPGSAVDELQSIDQTFGQLRLPHSVDVSPLQQRRTAVMLDRLLTQTQGLFDTLEHWGNTARQRHEKLDSRSQILMLAMPILVLLMLAGLALLISSRVLRPLSKLSESVHAAARGDLTVRSATTRADEIGEVSRTFDALAIDLVTQLKNREAMLQQIFDTSSVAIFLVDLHGRLTHANQRTTEMFGWPLQQLVGMEYVELIHPSEREQGRQKVLALLASELPSVDLDRLYWRQDQSEFWGHLTGRRLVVNSGSGGGLVGVINDISERKAGEERMRLAASVFSHAREGILITNPDGTIVEINESFTRITGYTRSEIIGQKPSMLQSGRQSPEFYRAMWQAIGAAGYWSGEIWNRRKNGDIYAQILTISVVKNAVDAVQHYVALFTDITMLKQHQQELEHNAHYDALTGLPNRVLLADRLRTAALQVLRRGHLLAVAYLDLDGFKEVNDQHGHEAGDQLLIALAQAMKAALREGDTLARIGGDEFVAVLADLERIQDCEPVLMRLLQAASCAITVGEVSLAVSASIGVTLYPQDTADADQLLRHADQAMYQAKQSGKNRFHLFDIHHDTAVKTQRAIFEQIHAGLERNEFVLYYQPKVNMKTGAVIGAEALIRWQHPERGLLAPAEFLPYIEGSPLVVEVGAWVVRTALQQMSHWLGQGLTIPVSINVDALQLLHQDFVNALGGVLAQYPQISPHRLEIEILETSALNDMVRVSHVMHACHELGVRFALDDFGTGYSSLTYLKRLPAQTLKIDQSFVRNMLSDAEDLAIVEGIIGLAQAFRRDVIAEGMETAEHGIRLLSLGCCLAQGYGVARPMPAADLPDWVLSWRGKSSWESML